MDTRWRILVLLGAAGAALWLSALPAAADGPVEEGVVTGGALPEAEIEATTEAAGGRPRFQLPWRWDVLWQAGSPHDTNGSALDFGPRRVGGNDDVLAAAAGVVQRVTCSGGSYPRIVHGNGWVSSYYHIVNVNWGLVGRRVLAGTRLGDAGQATPCGGRSTFRHVHFEVHHRGRAVNLDGISMGGYTVHSSGQRYSGHWTDDGSGAVVVRNPGEARCCLRSTTRPFAFPDQGRLADVNGDGRDDFGLRRSATLSVSTDSGVPGGDPDREVAVATGRNTDQVHLGDVTGDGRADLVLRRGTEFLINHDRFQPGGDASIDRRFRWGSAGSRVFLADMNGDGRDDFVLRTGAVVAVSTDSAVPGGDPGAEQRFRFGLAGDRMLLGDVDGDGAADVVLQRGNSYIVRRPGTSPLRFTWGAAGARLHLGDVNGDGRDDFVLRSGTRFVVSTDSAVPGGDVAREGRITWGQRNDLVHVGDLNGDGIDDLVLRRANRFYVNTDAFRPGGDAAGDRSFFAGAPTDQLVVQPNQSP